MLLHALPRACRVRKRAEGDGWRCTTLYVLSLSSALCRLLRSLCEKVVGPTCPEADAHFEVAMLGGKGIGRRLAGRDWLRGHITCLLLTVSVRNKSYICSYLLCIKKAKNTLAL